MPSWGGGKRATVEEALALRDITPHSPASPASAQHVSSATSRPRPDDAKGASRVSISRSCSCPKASQSAVCGGRQDASGDAVWRSVPQLIMRGLHLQKCTLGVGAGAGAGGGGCSAQQCGHPLGAGVPTAHAAPQMLGNKPHARRMWCQGKQRSAVH